MPGGADRIEQEMGKGGFRTPDLRRIILTHAHVDHMGNAAELKKRSGAEVLAHRDDIPYINGEKSLPAGSLRGRMMNWISDRILLGRRHCKVDRALVEGDRIGALGGVYVIHTPGHTPGSICLYQKRLGILFCGDAIFNMNPLTEHEGLRLPLPAATVDMEQARLSVRKLAETAVETICFGHGPPILNEAGRRVAAWVAEENL
jgi:glyoxylase-like metal-dependent hydrolase (beta-lactamase superfamily II)